MHAAGPELGLELSRPCAPDQVGVAGLSGELGLTQSCHLQVYV